jgi:hypothetical protein
MEDREIKEEEMQCISNCIHRYWNLPDDLIIDDRDQKYEQCLTDCEICS